MEQLDNLPDEVLLNIFSFFNKRKHGQASTVNKHFYRISTDKTLRNLPFPLLDYSQQPYAVKILTNKVKNIFDSTMLTNGKVILNIPEDLTLSSLYVWDVEQNKCTPLKEIHHTCKLFALANGQLVSFGRHFDNNLKIWDIDRVCCLNTLSGHTDMITALTELPNGHVFSASKDNTFKVWDLKKDKCLISINIGRDEPITELITLSNGNILGGSESGTLYLLNVIDNYKRYSMIGHEASISALVELPTGEVLSASKDGTCKLWDVNSRICVNTFKKSDTPHNNSFIFKFIVLPNKMQLVCLTMPFSCPFPYLALLPSSRFKKARTEPSVWIWDIQEKKYLHSLTDNRTYLASLYVLPNGQIITLGEKGLENWLFPELKHELTETDLSSNLNKLNFKKI